MVFVLDVKLFYQLLPVLLVLLLLLGVLTQPLLPNKIKVFLFTLLLFVSLVKTLLMPIQVKQMIKHIGIVVS